MKIKALVSFAGAFSMYVGEEREVEDNEVIQDLISCNYIEEVKATRKKVVKEDESK